MKKIWISLAVFIFIILLILFIPFFTRLVENKVSSSIDDVSIPGNQNMNASSGIIISNKELEKHNNESDCWIGFRYKVYDITPFLPSHPGSAAAIIPYCGTSSEFEQAFLAQHGSSKVQKLYQIGIYKGDLQ